MKLDEVIRSSDLTEAEIARRAGCSQSTVNKVRNGSGNPTFGLLSRISEATGGLFMPSDYGRPEGRSTPFVVAARAAASALT